MTKNILMLYKETEEKGIQEEKIVNNRETNTQIILEDHKKKNMHLKNRVK